MNSVMGEVSKRNGRSLTDNNISASWEERLGDQEETVDLMAKTWAKQRVTRWLVYFGVGLVLLAGVLSNWAAST